MSREAGDERYDPGHQEYLDEIPEVDLQQRHERMIEYFASEKHLNAMRNQLLQTRSSILSDMRKWRAALKLEKQKERERLAQFGEGVAKYQRMSRELEELRLGLLSDGPVPSAATLLVLDTNQYNWRDSETPISDNEKERRGEDGGSETPQPIQYTEIPETPKQEDGFASAVLGENIRYPPDSDAGKVQFWLESLGMGQHTEKFITHGITASEMGDLTDNELKEIGVNLLGHRKILMRAIRAFKSALRSDTGSEQDLSLEEDDHNLQENTLPTNTSATVLRNTPLPPISTSVQSQLSSSVSKAPQLASLLSAQPSPVHPRVIQPPVTPAQPINRYSAIPPISSSTAVGNSGARSVPPLQHKQSVAPPGQSQTHTPPPIVPVTQPQPSPTQHVSSQQATSTASPTPQPRESQPSIPAPSFDNMPILPPPPDHTDPATAPDVVELSGRKLYKYVSVAGKVDYGHYFTDPSTGQHMFLPYTGEQSPPSSPPQSPLSNGGQGLSSTEELGNNSTPTKSSTCVIS